ncbi:MAG: CD1108 family mobile element protein [Faecalibacterium sp.]
MSKKKPRLKFVEEQKQHSTRSPPECTRPEPSQPPKKKLKLDADKVRERAEHLRFRRAEITVEEASRMTKAQKCEMYAAAAARSVVHEKVAQEGDENAGVKSLHEAEKGLETSDRLSKSRYARKLKKQRKAQEKKRDTTKYSVSKKGTAQDADVSHPLSRWKQRRDIQKRFRAAARSGAQAAGSHKAATGSISVSHNTFGQIVDKGKTLVQSAASSVVTAARSNAHLLVVIGVMMMLILLSLSAFSSCAVLFGGSTQVSGQVFYTAKDSDIQGAEEDYRELEKKLKQKIDRTPMEHPGYNEYQYHLDPIEHDPWQLTSYLTTLHDDYTRGEVQGTMQALFQKQYILTTWVEVQIRYKTIWLIDPITLIPYPVEVLYEYRIFHTKLVNKGMETVIYQEMDADQQKRYGVLQETKGGRPYLFGGGLFSGLFGSSGGTGSLWSMGSSPGADYQIPAEALTDPEFAALMQEAQKHLGTPYVWGGSTPETGFDCSGFVCWVLNQSGYEVGRTTAEGLWQKSTPISESEARPGDLVFFEGTYDTPGRSHIGIYVGGGMMISAGDPVKYSNIHSSYWEKHLSGFGRISKE